MIEDGNYPTDYNEKPWSVWELFDSREPEELEIDRKRGVFPEIDEQSKILTNLRRAEVLYKDLKNVEFEKYNRLGELLPEYC